MTPFATIRRAKARDFLAIHAIDRNAWANLKETPYLPDGEHTWRIWCEHAVCYVAVKEDEIIGFILAFPTLTPELFCFHKIAVAEAYRGLGAGKLLVQQLLDEMQQTGASCFLTVAPYNNVAIELYTSLGFQKSDFVQGYYRDNEDRQLMVYHSAV